MTAPKAPENDFVLVYTSDRPLEIEAAISLLAEQKIPTFTINKQDSNYIFGEIELYVPEADVWRAHQILVENELQ